MNDTAEQLAKLYTVAQLQGFIQTESGSKPSSKLRKPELAERLATLRAMESVSGAYSDATFGETGKSAPKTVVATDLLDQQVMVRVPSMVRIKFGVEIDDGVVVGKVVEVADRRGMSGPVIAVKHDGVARATLHSLQDVAVI